MQETKPIRVLIVDNHSLVREAMTRLINIQPDMKVVAEASNGKVALDCYEEISPDVTLMDLSMPVMNGIESVKAIRKNHPDARFIILSAYDFPEDIQNSLQAGAVAYLLKDTSRDKLIRVIREVHQGHTFL
jgi:two-component system, NarL family, response regulator